MRFILSALLIISLGFVTSCNIFTPDGNENGSKQGEIPGFKSDVRLSEPDVTGIPDSVSKAYRDDAEIMAYRYLEEHDSTRVVISDELIEFFWRGVVHVYKINHPARDAVVETYAIHNPPPRHITRGISVGADTSSEWTEAWVERRSDTTGYAPVDSLMAEYELSVDRISVYDNRVSVDLRTNLPINPNALARIFEEEVPDLQYAEGHGFIGGSDFIRTEVNKNYMLYTYSHGWGDCPAGCINRHYWDFKIYENGEIEFTGSRGDPLEE